VLYSTDQLWAHQTQPHAKGFDYLKQCLPAYHGLRDAGIDVDIVNEESDLSGYRLLIAPAWQLVPADAAEAVIDFVRNGGTAVFTFRTGVKDWDGVIFADPLPGPLRDLLGITIDDYDALGSKSATAIVQANHPALPAAPLSGTIWADVITAEDAEVAATFADQWYAGRPAITVNRFGRGQAWYIGASLGGDLWTPLVRHLLAQAALPAVRVSGGVEVSHRQGDRLYTFALNMRNEPGWIELDAPMTDLLTGEVVGSGRVAIEGFGVRVLV
jgi:beta-galactosidase